MKPCKFAWIHVSWTWNRGQRCQKMTWKELPAISRVYLPISVRFCEIPSESNRINFEILCLHFPFSFSLSFRIQIPLVIPLDQIHCFSMCSSGYCPSHHKSITSPSQIDMVIDMVIDSIDAHMIRIYSLAIHMLVQPRLDLFSGSSAWVFCSWPWQRFLSEPNSQVKHR